MYILIIDIITIMTMIIILISIIIIIIIIKEKQDIKHTIKEWTKNQIISQKMMSEKHQKKFRIIKTKKEEKIKKLKSKI